MKQAFAAGGVPIRLGINPNSVDPRFDEIATVIRLSGAVRTAASHKTLHVQAEGDLTPEQLDAIAAATSVFPTLIYDVHAPDGSDFHTGEGLLDFLDDPLVAEALRRGTT